MQPGRQVPFQHRRDALVLYGILDMKGSWQAFSTDWDGASFMEQLSPLPSLRCDVCGESGYWWSLTEWGWPEGRGPWGSASAWRLFLVLRGSQQISNSCFHCDYLCSNLRLLCLAFYIQHHFNNTKCGIHNTNDFFSFFFKRRLCLFLFKKVIIYLFGFARS